jgi:hypothetical protein
MGFIAGGLESMHARATRTRNTTRNPARATRATPARATFDTHDTTLYWHTLNKLTLTTQHERARTNAVILILMCKFFNFYYKRFQFGKPGYEVTTDQFAEEMAVSMATYVQVLLPPSLPPSPYFLSSLPSLPFSSPFPLPVSNYYTGVRVTYVVTQTHGSIRV